MDKEQENKRDIKRGEVYYISPPGKTVPVGSEYRGGRPAVIVSADFFNYHSPVFAVCYLTLQNKLPATSHVKIPDGKCYNSTILCEQITSVSIQRIGEYMCTLSDEVMKKVDKGLKVSLSLVGDDTIPDSGVVNSCFCSSDESESYLAQIAELKSCVDKLKVERNTVQEELDATKSALQESSLYKKLYEDLLTRVVGR